MTPVLVAAAVASGSCAGGASPDPERPPAAEGAVTSGPSTTSTTAAATTSAPAPTSGPRIVWQATDACADSILASDRIVVANCDGSVMAYARSTGAFQWGRETGDDGAATPGITADGTVVYTPFAYPQGALAFEGLTGREVDVPTAGVQTSYTAFDPPAEEVLPPGYSYGPEGLSLDGTLIWAGGRPDVTGTGPFVHRQAGVTVINDLDTGTRIVADDGTVLLAPELGQRWFSASPVWDVGRDQVAVASADGVLRLLDLRRVDTAGSSAPPTDPRQ